MAEKKPRPGEKNLIPINERTVEEQRLMRHNGGKASGVARRKKKQLRQIMLDLLAKDVMDTKQLRKVANMGYDEDEIDNATASGGLPVQAGVPWRCIRDQRSAKSHWRGYERRRHAQTGRNIAWRGGADQ